MHGERDGALLGRGAEHLDAERRVRVQDELPHLPRADVGEPLHEAGQLRARNGQDHELRPAHHLERVEHRHVGQHGRRAIVVGSAGDAGDGVPRARERGADHRADPAGPDDADPQTSVASHAPYLSPQRCV